MHPQALIDRVVVKMRMDYMHKFSSIFIDLPIEEWEFELSGAVADFTPREIGDALTLMRDTYPDWPPTIGQFRGLCKAARKPTVFKALPAPALPPEVVDARLAMLAEAAGRFGAIPQDSKYWARNIVSAWEKGDYPNRYGYCLACKAIGVDPKARPEKPYSDRQQAAAGEEVAA